MMLRHPQTPARAAARAGFTLMELLVVIAILLVLVSVATPIYFTYLAKARIDTAKAECKTLARELDAYATSHLNEHPDTEGYPPVAEDQYLNYLYEIKRLKKLPIDPWRTPYRAYVRMIDPTKETAETYTHYAVVVSAGPDRTFDTADDIYSEYGP